MVSPMVKFDVRMSAEAENVIREPIRPPAERQRTDAKIDPTQLLLPRIGVELDFQNKTYRAAMRRGPRAILTTDLLQDMLCVQESVRQIMSEGNREQQQLLEYFVFASETPGVFSLGSDLDRIAGLIRAGDRTGLQAYAYAGIDVIHGNAMAFHAPIVTIALVQGDALGSGLECALSFDVLVAEKSAKMGLPEALFNLIPGMGAYSFLARKIGTIAAEKLIMSGKVYTAEELHGLGVVDVLADDGEGDMAVREYIERNRRKHNAHRAIYRSRRQVDPVTYEELRDIADIWVEAALGLGERDLRTMSRLTSAQSRRLATS